MPSEPPVLVAWRNPPQSVSTSAAYSVRRQMDNRVGSCKWHLKIAYGYERDSRVVPALRGGLAQSGANAARFARKGKTKKEKTGPSYEQTQFASYNQSRESPEGSLSGRLHATNSSDEFAFRRDDEYHSLSQPFSGINTSIDTEKQRERSGNDEKREITRGKKKRDEDEQKNRTLSWHIDKEERREKEKRAVPGQYATNSVPPHIIVTFVRTRVDRPNFARSGKTTVRGQFLERPALHHRLLVISLSMVETPFDYPRLRRGTTRYKSSVGWCEAEMVVRVADSCEQHSGFRAGDRLNAVGEAPTDTLLARFLIRISVLSIARGRT
ncbi:hypothetical protein ALC62_08221 [Cyphomyrmex costatus]|uniref:Uncharacterized protein n=1 Tax=Cyphomyrmex costatus TaxID=456900 RepID=A0A195CJT8_9HYME|nr:hypothetical protein ALC62_08221 [Cyphomyrmex costatus]